MNFLSSSNDGFEAKQGDTGYSFIIFSPSSFFFMLVFYLPFLSFPIEGEESSLCLPVLNHRTLQFLLHPSTCPPVQPDTHSVVLLSKFI